MDSTVAVALIGAAATVATGIVGYAYNYWTFTRADLDCVLAKITEREPRLALAA